MALRAHGGSVQDGLMNRCSSRQPADQLTFLFIAITPPSCLQVTRACDWPANVAGCGPVVAAKLAGRRMQEV